MRKGENRMDLRKYKKLTLMLLTVGLILGLMSAAQAQPKTGFSLKVGMFTPSDVNITDTWENGITYGLGYLYAFPPYGIAFEAEYLSITREMTIFPVTETVEWRVIPITGTFLYFLPGAGGFSPYVGAGIGYYLTRVGVDVAVAGIPFLGLSEEESGIGFHAQVGFTLGKHFFAEAKYSMANVEYFETINAGGLTILAGYRS